MIVRILANVKCKLFNISKGNNLTMLLPRCQFFTMQVSPSDRMLKHINKVKSMNQQLETIQAKLEKN